MKIRRQKGCSHLRDLPPIKAIDFQSCVKERKNIQDKYPFFTNLLFGDKISKKKKNNPSSRQVSWHNRQIRSEQQNQGKESQAVRISTPSKKPNASTPIFHFDHFHPDNPFPTCSFHPPFLIIHPSLNPYPPPPFFFFFLFFTFSKQHHKPQ